MRLNIKVQNNLIEFICLLYILLFVYAAVSKFLDFDNFQIQIGQSPLLSAFTGFVSYGVPLIELGLALVLLLPKYRIWGLYGSFFLMIMFTTYIFIILNFSSFIPCSCGGILEKLGWTEHLLFNSAFVFLAILAIVLKAKTKFVFGFLTIHLVGGISIVAVLFWISEDIIQHRNNFIRRFPDQVHKVYDSDLHFNSYYFAGVVKDKIYLGNYTAPLLLTEIDPKLTLKKEHIVRIDNLKLPYRSLELRVEPNYFYAIDGTIPQLFKGKTGEWSAKTIIIPKTRFSNPVIIDSSSIAYRTHKVSGESALGSISFGKIKSSYLNPFLLEKQIDGIFDCDGSLMFDNFTKKVVYLYRYRNQFIVTDSKLNLNFRGKTIDTISKAQIKISYNKERDERKLSSPPMTVNRTGILHKGLLFVHSALIGKFEDVKMWQQTSIVDVYDYSKSTYIVSFYVYNIAGKKMNRFYVTDTNFYALIDTHIVSYQLSDIIKQRFNTTK